MTTAAAFSVTPGLLIRHSAKQDKQTGQSEGSTHSRPIVHAAHTLLRRRKKRQDIYSRQATWQCIKGLNIQQPVSQRVPLSKTLVRKHRACYKLTSHISTQNKYARETSSLYDPLTAYVRQSQIGFATDLKLTDEKKQNGIKKGIILSTK